MNVYEYGSRKYSLTVPIVQVTVALLQSKRIATPKITAPAVGRRSLTEPHPAAVGDLAEHDKHFRPWG